MPKSQRLSTPDRPPDVENKNSSLRACLNFYSPIVAVSNYSLEEIQNLFSPSKLQNLRTVPEFSTVSLSSIVIGKDDYGYEKSDAGSVSSQARLRRIDENLSNPNPTPLGHTSFCAVCHKALFSLVDLNLHMQTHISSPLRKREIHALKTATSQKSKYLGMRHKMKKVFYCRPCAKTFTTAQNLRRHSQTTSCQGTPKFRINVSGKKSSRVNLCDPTRPFKCKPCRSSFKTSSHLKRHLTSQSCRAQKVSNLLDAINTSEVETSTKDACHPSSSKGVGSGTNVGGDAKMLFWCGECGKCFANNFGKMVNHCLSHYFYKGLPAPGKTQQQPLSHSASDNTVTEIRIELPDVNYSDIFTDNPFTPLFQADVIESNGYGLKNSLEIDLETHQNARKKKAHNQRRQPFVLEILFDGHQEVSTDIQKVEKIDTKPITKFNDDSSYSSQTLDETMDKSDGRGGETKNISTPKDPDEIVIEFGTFGRKNSPTKESPSNPTTQKMSPVVQKATVTTNYTPGHNNKGSDSDYIMLVSVDLSKMDRHLLPTVNPILKTEEFESDDEFVIPKIESVESLFIELKLPSDNAHQTFVETAVLDDRAEQKNAYQLPQKYDSDNQDKKSNKIAVESISTKLPESKSTDAVPSTRKLIPEAYANVSHSGLKSSGKSDDNFGGEQNRKEYLGKNKLSSNDKISTTFRIPKIPYQRTQEVDLKAKESSLSSFQKCTRIFETGKDSVFIGKNMKKAVLKRQRSRSRDKKTKYAIDEKMDPKSTERGSSRKRTRGSQSSRKSRFLMYTCQICDEKYDKQLDLFLHARSHNFEQPFYLCHVCNFKPFFWRDMVQHALVAHPESNKVFGCIYCPAGFKRDMELIEHTTASHGESSNEKTVIKNKLPNTDGE